MCSARSISTRKRTTRTSLLFSLLPSGREGVLRFCAVKLPHQTPPGGNFHPPNETTPPPPSHPLHPVDNCKPSFFPPPLPFPPPPPPPPPTPTLEHPPKCSFIDLSPPPPLIHQIVFFMNPLNLVEITYLPNPPPSFSLEVSECPFLS